jgi:sorbin and SH3 domain-containing protein 1
MRKGDIIYLLRDVDKNWFEAEHHGCVGIVPKSYVSVLTSIEQAHTSAGEREGQATAKFNFVPRTNAELPLKKVNY